MPFIPFLPSHPRATIRVIRSLARNHIPAFAPDLEMSHRFIHISLFILAVFFAVNSFAQDTLIVTQDITLGIQLSPSSLGFAINF